MTKTAFFDELHFAPSEKKDTHLLPQDIAQTLLHVITSPMVIEDITLRAQRFEIKKKK